MARITWGLGIPKQFKELITPTKHWRHIVFHGGRASGKSWSVAQSLLFWGSQKKLRILCCREIQNSIAESVHKLLCDLIDTYNLPGWSIQRESIKNVNGTDIIFYGLKKDSQKIKSLEGVDICWVEEAQTVSTSSIDVLVPTIRTEGSYFIWTFNRLSESDPVWVKLCQKPNDDTYVKQVNSADINQEFLSGVVIYEREKMKKENQDLWEHVWNGKPLTAMSGSVFGKQIDLAYSDKRICNVPYDGSVPVYTAWDLGIGDSTAIWFFQLVNREIHFIDHYENCGEELGHYIEIINARPYKYAKHYLPHDAKARELQSGLSREEFFHKTGILNTDILSPNTSGMGIELTRGLFSRMWIDENNCERGIECIKAYHYAYDEKNRLNRTKPEHDWSSHSSDCFQYAAMAIEKLEKVASGGGPQFLVEKLTDEFGFY